MSPQRRERHVVRLGKTIEFALAAIPVLGGLSKLLCEDAPCRREKFISETGLLLYAASLVTGLPNDTIKRIREAGALLAPYARDDHMLMAMRLKPSIAAEFGVAHACLTRLGIEDPPFDHELRLLLQDPATAFFERVPWKDLEAEWIHRLAGRDCRELARADTRRFTVNVGLDALTATRNQMYAFTHCLIYMAEFGTRVPSTERAVDLILDDAEAALVSTMDSDDFDLAAELLLAWPLLRHDWSNTAVFCYDILRSVENEVGFLPSLSIRMSQFKALQGAAQRHYYLLEAYHTVYVSGLLAAACLCTHHLPPAAIIRTGFHADPDLILGSMPDLPSTPQWQQRFDTLFREEQAYLTPFLAAIAVRRSIVSGDLHNLDILLDVWRKHSFPVTTLYRQAYAFRRRIAR